MGDIVRFEKGVVRRAVGAMAALERRAAHKAHRVFVPSRYAAATLCDCYGISPRKVRVMRNGIFYDEWTRLVEGIPADEARPPTVLCAARLYRRKGVDDLLRAWPEVMRRVDGAHLVIAGDGLEYRNLTRLSQELGIAERVRFAGDVRDRAEMARLYAHCDLLCLPSRHETFGLVFLEALAAARPVVAVDATAVPEVVRHGIDGLLTPEGDIGALSEALAFLLENPAERAKMGSEGRERVKKDFQWSRVIAPLIEWMEEGYA